MANINISTDRKVKKMKPMHGGGQPPIGGYNLVEFFHYMTDAGIPFSRLHDVGGPFGSNRFVDIPNIFRNFDADENDPDNYDFVFTDYLIKAIIDAGVEPYFRLGITIENHAYIKAYNTHPPKDPEKWARICEHIIRHYTEGWANGHRYTIRYWEIWNEPEVQNEMMWCGTPEEYYNLYDVTAKHLKACFPHLMIGGYASCGFYAIAPENGLDPETNLPGTIPPSDHEKLLMDFFSGFFTYIQEHSSPIDFFSWHTYTDVTRAKVMDKWLHHELEKLGYGGIETHLNEWNPYCTEYGTAHHSAEVAAMMIEMQKGYADVLCIYDMAMNSAPYCPLFDIRTKKPIHAYYSMVAFNQLYKLKDQVYAESDAERLHVLAASDGNHNACIVVNLTGKKHELSINGADLSSARFYVLDNERLLSWAPNANKIENNALILIEW